MVNTNRFTNPIFKTSLTLPQPIGKVNALSRLSPLCGKMIVLLITICREDILALFIAEFCYFAMLKPF